MGGKESEVGREGDCQTGGLEGGSRGLVERESNFAEEQEKERECVREREGLQEEAGHKEGRNSAAVALARLRASKHWHARMLARWPAHAP